MLHMHVRECDDLTHPVCVATDLKKQTNKTTACKSTTRLGFKENNVNKEFINASPHRGHLVKRGGLK